ncbi:MAG: hypothetical protein DRR16_05405 [Candidatus Parabeggiatoa sp. nov. 3]|nr:MAG: hypothetical protein DRR00_10615 [Gammaproteobacteria bacterium]RKZ67374.1 MAG: hypothetical protein DRQ99_06845 [Gammaproteobacteria bacterium]RKZ88209.1 MAG: hypothetical protein DRR16_05405 [Gammaproteobacteria bacterium]
MMSNNTTVQFETAITKALSDFEQRLEQQRSFQIQNHLLKKLHEEIKIIGYCDSQKIEDLSLEYEDFHKKLSESGRSYENIVEEKNLVDVYSAFEKFLSDCFYSIYLFFPKYLGEKITVSTHDLFIGGDIELCKKNIIELEVKSFIQANHIIEIVSSFKKKFSIKKIESSISKDDLNILYEISLIRNLITHNNSIVNRVYIEQVKKFLKDKAKYEFHEGETVLGKLENLTQDMKDISTKVCEKIAEAIINDSNRLKNHHENM